MKRSEVSVMMALFAAAYGREPTDEQVSVWQEFLADVDSAAAGRAARRHIATSPHYPTVSDIRRLVADEECAAPDADRAWAEVLDAVRRWGRYREPTFSHAAITEAVAGVGWLAICDSEAIGVERAHFLKLYEQSRARHVREANVGPLLPAAERRQLEPRSAGAAVSGLLKGIRERKS